MVESVEVSYKAWLASRPESVRKLAGEFPPGSRFLLPSDGLYYLLGYTEQEELIISPINPTVDYDRSYELRQVIHASHFRTTSTVN